jgi:hypothetical protein
MGGAFTEFSMPLASTTLNLRWGLSIIALLQVLTHAGAPNPRVTRVLRSGILRLQT